MALQITVRESYMSQQQNVLWIYFKASTNMRQNSGILEIHSQTLKQNNKNTTSYEWAETLLKYWCN